nr:reverse transcriptase [Tanacetum cinerariifolium]
MPFGLMNAPSSFQAAMNDLFRDLKFVLVFMDDILVFSDSWERHLHDLNIVLERLWHNKFYVKLSKCVFGVSEVTYLGHIISARGVEVDPEKIRAIVEWPLPRDLTVLHGFLGLTGYYRRFVKKYATIASPLTNMLQADNFVWTLESREAFEKLKQHMIELPTLALPDFLIPFDVTTDASGSAIGAVLSPRDHPLAFFSKKLSSRMQAASTYIREMYAIIESVKRWRHYLLGKRFRIFTDQRSLKFILNQNIQTPEQQKWLSKLLGYEYDILYKPGKENTVANALSRIDSSHTPTFCA